MNVAIASRNGSFEGVSFAVPINMVKAVKAAGGDPKYTEVKRDLAAWLPNGTAIRDELGLGPIQTHRKDT